MYDPEEITTPKARKDYRCVWCDEMIPKGSTHTRRTGRFDGEWRNERWHPECVRASENLDVGDTFSPGNHIRGSLRVSD